MAKQNFSYYSLLDIVSTMNHPDVGKCCLSDAGGGQITFSSAGDMFSNTKTATGYVTINRMRSEDGTGQLEIPVNTQADVYLLKWVAFMKNRKTKTARTVLTTLTIFDPLGNNGKGKTITLKGVVPQKEADINYQQTAGNRTYPILYAEKIEK